MPDDKPADPAVDPAAAPPAGDPAPAADPAPTGDAGEGEKAGKVYDEKYVKSLRDEAAKGRQGKTAAETERDQAKARLDAVLKALDPDAKGDADPAEAAKAALTKAEQHAAELKAERLERAAEKAARRLGVDEVALLDSRGFLAKLANLDPAGDGFADDLEAAVNAAVGVNPRLKATAAAAPPASATAELTGGGQGGSEQLTRAQLKTMTPKQIEQARADGKLKHLLGG